MKFKKVLSLFMTAILFSLSMPLNVFAQENADENTITTEDATISGSALTVISPEIDVDFNVTGQWDGGFNSEITITNLTDTVIENWQIQMEFPQEITNIWNAAIASHKGVVYVIKNIGGNNNVNIPANGCISFGFSGSFEGEIAAPQNVQLVGGKTIADEDDYTIKYDLLSDWGDGYNAQITINNNTDAPMEAWHLEFDFDREITNIWNGVIEKHENGKHFITNAGYNSIIPANGCITFGFNGNGGNVTIEPDSYVLTYSSDDYVSDNPDTDFEIDTDGDGLYDWIEEIVGSDKNITDTDEDGLSDYYEVYYTGTDPTQYDTYGDDICDADRDMEHDGLTNIEEMNYGSNPLLYDSDYDGLSDKEEVNAYNTNPALYDTDDDGLNDKDEITLGFDPQNPDTDGNGILDGDEKTHQTISYKVECEEKPEIINVQINMDCTEVIDKTTTIQPMYGVDVYTSDLVGLVGSPIEIETTSKFDVAEVIFTYNPDDLNGVPEDNLGIMWYDTDSGIFEHVNSVVDKNNHTVTFTTTHFSEWVLCDEEKYNQAINDIPDYTSLDLSGNSNWNGEVLNTKELSELIGYRESDVVAMTENQAMYVVKTNVTYTINSGISFTNVHYFYSSQPMTDAYLYYVDEGTRACIAPRNWHYTTYTYIANGDYDFGLDSYGEEIGLPRSEDIDISNPGTMEILEKYFVPISGINTTDTDCDGLYDVYETVGMRLSNGQYIYSDPEKKDTDGDGLNDGEEVFTINRNVYLPLRANSLQSTQSKRNPSLPRIIANYNRNDIMLLSANSNNGNPKGLFGQTSDPNLEDTDGDLVVDGVDFKKQQYNVNDEFFFYLNQLEFYTKIYLENNKSSNKEQLIYMFIRSFNNNYRGKNWTGVAGGIDDEFINYIKTNDFKTYDYFSKTDHIYSGQYFSFDNNESKNTGLVDLYHLFATLNALEYKSDWNSAEQISNKIKFQIMPEKYIDQLAGWAGDLQTIMCLVQAEDTNYNTDINKIFSTAKKYIASTNIDGNFAIDDMYSDADAVNLYMISRTSKDKPDLTIQFRNYYVTDYSHRFSTFISNEFPLYNILGDGEISAVAITYTSLKFCDIVKWPLYKDSSYKVENITSAEKISVADAFESYLVERYNYEHTSV